MWELLPVARYIGEVGLDFVDRTYKNEQLAFFSELIERCRYDKDKIITSLRKQLKDAISRCNALEQENALLSYQLEKREKECPESR